MAVMGLLIKTLVSGSKPLHHGHWQDQDPCIIGIGRIKTSVYVSCIHAQINVVTYISDILVDVMYYFFGILGTSLEKKAAALTSAICYS